jgi:hypothetical protein
VRGRCRRVAAIGAARRDGGWGIPAPTHRRAVTLGAGGDLAEGRLDADGFRDAASIKQRINRRTTCSISMTFTKINHMSIDFR